MSVGRRRRKAAERIAAEQRRIAERQLWRKLGAGVCHNCGEPGPHFAPPGFGTAGFYICDPSEADAMRWTPNPDGPSPV